MSKNELYQYENLLKIYKNCIKNIRDNPKLSDKDKKGLASQVMDMLE